MKYIDDYDHLKGHELEFPEAIDAAALIEHLGIPKSKVGIVSVNGDQVKQDTVLPDKALVRVFQPIFGG